MPPFPPFDRPLDDGHVELRYAAERDIPEVLIAHDDDPDLHVRRGMAKPPTGAELGSQAERAEADRIAGTRITLTILEPGHDLCLGQIPVHTVDWSDLRAELGIWLAPQARGRGRGGRALRLAAVWLIVTCGLQRVQAITEPDNEAMLATARAAGFQREGLLRGYVRERGARLDGAVLSLVGADLRD